MIPTGKEAVALELLRGGREMYGLEMVRASNGALLRGTIYVLLDRLEDKGWVSSRVEKQSDQSGMPRPRYRITGLGQRALAARDAAEATLAGAQWVLR
jgi:PadR family transcriptional regulator, regulatory protein PadR